MARKKPSWIDEKPRFPSLCPPYVCPKCKEQRTSAQYGTNVDYQCAQCEWSFQD